MDIVECHSQLFKLQDENELLHKTLDAAMKYIDCNVCDQDTTAKMWEAWQELQKALKELDYAT